MALWRKSHLSCLGHFKTTTSSLREKKNAVKFYFQIYLFVPEIFKFLIHVCKLAGDVMHSNKFWSNLMKRDISANLYQKYLILYNKSLLSVLHNTNLRVLLPWQHTGFQTSAILKAFLTTFGVLFWYLLTKQCFICMIQQAYKYVSLSMWPCLTFLGWKSLTYWNQMGGDWKRVSCHGNGYFKFPAKLSTYLWSALQIGQGNSICILNIIFGWVYDVISHLISIFHPFFKLEYFQKPVQIC